MREDDPTVELFKHIGVELQQVRLVLNDQHGLTAPLQRFTGDFRSLLFGRAPVPGQADPEGRSLAETARAHPDQWFHFTPFLLASEAGDASR